MGKCIWLAAGLTVILALMLAVVPVHAADATISPGDTLKITVLGEQDLSRQTPVDPAGNIVLPLAGEINVAGKTPADATSAVVEALKKYIKNPQVTVEVAALAKRSVAIGGAVKTPGLYPVGANTKLVDLISLAGGQAGNADMTRITITRSQTKENITANLQEFFAGRNPEGNTLLQDGDSVMVPQMGAILVMGQVRNPGQIQLTSQMTLKQAVERAGGVTEAADTTKINVKRASSGKVESVSLSKVLQGDPASDLVLNDKDEVDVPAIVVLGKFTATSGVRSPGVYPITGQMTVTDAISLAGGPSNDAKLDRVTLLRGQQSMKINLAQVYAGKAANVAVLPGDSISIDEGKVNFDPLRAIGVASSLLWLLFRR